MRPRTLARFGLLLGLIAPAAGLARGPEPVADGPTFTPEQMGRGIAMSAADCARYRATVFVQAEGQGICFRYYLGATGGDGTRAVFFLSGDKSGESLAYDPARIGRNVTSLSRAYGMPVVYLARMGIDGSSGSHRLRRTWLEVKATDLAVTAIMKRHGFTGLHVMGQSGGGHLTGSLVGLRGDIGCAVPGSGRLAFTQDYAAAQARRPPDRRHYDPITALPAIVKHSAATRILVVTDPGDERVPAASQTGFVRRVQKAGGRIAQFYVTATDDLSHGATPYTRRVMAECLKGTPDDEIATILARLSERRFSRQLPGGGQEPGTGPGRRPPGGSRPGGRAANPEEPDAGSR